MGHDNHLSGWPLLWSWLANGVLWLTYGMNPLQVVALVLTIGYTLHRWWILRRTKPND